jgi:hypothetical protein
MTLERDEHLALLIDRDGREQLVVFKADEKTWTSLNTSVECESSTGGRSADDGPAAVDLQTAEHQKRDVRSS